MSCGLSLTLTGRSPFRRRIVSPSNLSRKLLAEIPDFSPGQARHRTVDDSRHSAPRSGPPISGIASIQREEKDDKCSRFYAKHRRLVARLQCARLFDDLDIAAQPTMKKTPENAVFGGGRPFRIANEQRLFIIHEIPVANFYSNV